MTLNALGGREKSWAHTGQSGKRKEAFRAAAREGGESTAMCPSPPPAGGEI